MEKQVLLEKTNSYITCIKSFFDEYRDEWVYEKEDRLMTLLNDVWIMGTVLMVHFLSVYLQFSI